MPRKQLEIRLGAAGDGNTGMAINGGFSECSEAQYEESDISEQSYSLYRIMRKKVSSTGWLR